MKIKREFFFVMIILILSCINKRKIDENELIIKMYSELKSKNNMDRKYKPENIKNDKMYIDKDLEDMMHYYFFEASVSCWGIPDQDRCLVRIAPSFVDFEVNYVCGLQFMPKYERGLIYLYWMKEYFFQCMYSFEEWFSFGEEVEKIEAGKLFATMRLISKDKLKIDYKNKKWIEAAKNKFDKSMFKDTLVIKWLIP